MPGASSSSAPVSAASATSCGPGCCVRRRASAAFEDAAKLLRRESAEAPAPRGGGKGRKRLVDRLLETPIGQDLGYKAARSQMGDMANSLQRDPQLESLLAGRRKDLGIGGDFDTGMGIGKDLALSHGLGLGRGIGL